MLATFFKREIWQCDKPNRRLAIALAASLVVHALIYGTWRISPTLSSFIRQAIERVLPLPAHKPKPQKLANNPPAPASDVPVTFIEVDPAAPQAEPPKETKFYSTQNTVAANPKPANVSDMPKIDGSQTKMLRLADNPKPQPKPLQPTPPKPEAKPEPEEPKQPESKPAKAPEVGDLAMARTEPRPPVTEQEAPKEIKRTKPRTVREAMQRNPALAGQKSQQQGGAPRAHLVPSVNAKASPFGDYDYAFIRAVEQRWFQLLEENNQYLYDRQGAVVLTFNLHFDGRVTDLHVENNSVGEILGLICQRAIQDPSPFPRWPTAMRQAVKSDAREVRFTFYYD